MAKSKAQKQALVEEYAGKLAQTKTVYFVRPNGISANNSSALKKALHAQGSSYNVVKNTLFKLALEKQGLPVPQSLDNGEHGVVYSSDAVSEVAKLIREHVKETEKLEVIGGILNGEVISAAQVEALADLPSKDQLLGQLLSVFNGPMRGLVTVLSGNMREFVQVLAAINDKKQSASA